MSKLLIVGLIIMVLDAVVSMLEAALFSLPRTKALVLSEKSSVGRIILQLKDNVESPITTLVSLSNFITILGGATIGVMTERIYGSAWVALSAAVLTISVMIFAEIIPKRLGERYAESALIVGAAPLFFASKIFSPVTWFIRIITSPFTKKPRLFTSEEEIAVLTRLGSKEGTIESDEAELIHRVFRLNDITAKDMMTPKSHTIFIDGGKKIGELADFIKSATHTRMPVFEGTKDNIIGMVHQRDLIRALLGGEHDREVKEFAADAVFVDESRLGDELMREFQEKRVHLAVVTNVTGNVLGVVGLEDVLEELVGEIIDEKDIAPDLIKRISKNEVLVHGQTRMSYLGHFFNLNIKSKKTLNRFLKENFGRLPEVNEEIALGGVRFIIDAVGPKEIERVRVVKPE